MSGLSVDERGGMGQERRRLDSWKEIAEYLGRNARTVARWERERGLPVHSVPGGRARTVFAYTDELDAWLARRGAAENGAADEAENGASGGKSPDPGSLALAPELTPASPPPAPAGRRRLALAAAILAAASALVATVRWTLQAAAPLEIAALDEVNDDLIARGRDRRELWRFTPGDPIVGLSSPLTWTAIADLLPGEGHEVIAAPHGTDAGQDRLYLLSNRGTLQWIRSLDTTLRFGGVPYGSPWRTNALTTFRAGGEPRIAWALHHHTWWPSIVQVLDASGSPLHRFVNFGWISALAPSADGRYLIAAGLANAYGSLTLVVLDAQSPGGTAPVPDDDRYVCDGCPPGRPVRAFILPRPDAAEAVMPGSLTPNGEQPQLRVLPGGAVSVIAWFGEVAPTRPQAIYEFSPDLQFLSARMSDDYWVWHRRVEDEGKLTHGADDCPERSGLRVREWSREAGWRWIGPPVN